MSPSPSLVQPIVLLVDKNDPAGHRDSILAAAIASTEAYAMTIQDAGADDGDAWAQWLSGRFTKSVRRADLKTFTKLASSTDLPFRSLVARGKARAMAYLPVTYEEMAKPLTRLQVSGTDLPELPVSEGSGTEGPVIVLNGDLGMSTGKSCAQAGHALFAWFLQEHAGGRTVPAASLARAGLRIVGAAEFAALRAGAVGPVIVDSGLTEIDPDTATAFVTEMPR